MLLVTHVLLVVFVTGGAGWWLFLAKLLVNVGPDSEEEKEKMADDQERKQIPELRLACYTSNTSQIDTVSNQRAYK